MAIEIVPLGAPGEKVSGRKYTVEERMYRTLDGRAVKEGDPDAAFVLFAPGEVIPLEQAERYGLVRPAAKPKAKQAAKPRDKQRGRAQDKQAAPARKKETPSG